MGNSESLAELAAQLPEGAKLFGLQNFGNTCYCNSVLQPLFHCRPFRDSVLRYAAKHNHSRRKADFEPERRAFVSQPISIMKDPKAQERELQKAREREMKRHAKEAKVLEASTVLSALGDLFAYVEQQKQQTLLIGPKYFRKTVGKENVMFSGPQQQDAHEFLYYIFTAIDDILAKEERERAEKVAATAAKKAGSALTQKASEKQNGRSNVHPPTWIREIFEGTLLNDTRCMCCERCTTREESFWDLSIDLEQNCSITRCLSNFFRPETLKGKNKFFCESCNSLQEAEKRMRIKRCPRILLLHLKRFKYNQQAGRFIKLGFRISFPFELRLFHTNVELEGQDLIYELSSIIVHKGSGPNHGHYVCFAKCYDCWLYFDDETVEMKSEFDVQSTFGSTRDDCDYDSGSTGYILFYQLRTEVEDESFLV